MARFNASTTSLNSPQLPNGSGLKQQIAAPVDLTDPLKTLDEIIGIPSQAADVERGGDDVSEKRLEIVESVDFEGVGLYDFLQEEDDEIGENSALHSAEECEYV